MLVLASVDLIVHNFGQDGWPKNSSGNNRGGRAATVEMRKLLLVLGVVQIFSSWPVAVALPTPVEHIVISELQTASMTSASEEFVELYNPLDEAVDITGWRLEYKSATGANWSSKATLSGSVESQGFYLIASTDYLTDAATAAMASGLAASGGHIRLVSLNDQQSEAVVDLLGWGTADLAETAPAPAPAAGRSLVRQVDADDNFIDQDNNSTDFVVSDTPDPQSTPPTVPDEDTNPDDLLTLVINELFVDPSSPQTDAEDEFVEIYNPNDEPVDLNDYVLQTGSSLQYQATITDKFINPGDYLALTSGETGLVLANSGGKAQLLSPDGAVAAGLVAYQTAPAGQSWSLLGASFVWTNQVTPNGDNLASTNPITDDNQENGVGSISNYPKILITEVLPDPASPQTDARDEFVELYNPNLDAVDLTGFVLKTGSSLKTSFVLPSVTIASNSYIAIFSIDASISLSNSGGSAQLLDPNGLVSSEIVPYGPAEEGQSWALVGGKWQWTAQPTPAAKNLLAVAAAKAKKAKSTAVKKSAKKSAAGDVLGSIGQPAAIPPGAVDWRLIGGVSALAAGYMIYEMRYDIRNQIYRFRRFSETKTSGA